MQPFSLYFQFFCKPALKNKVYQFKKHATINCLQCTSRNIRSRKLAQMKRKKEKRKIATPDFHEAGLLVHTYLPMFNISKGIRTKKMKHMVR